MGAAAADPRVGDLEAVVALMRDRRSVVLAGAGCSTESGIPDYRGPDGRSKVRKPVQYGDFVRSEATRRRYWARSTVGWRRVSLAKPNLAHDALARLENLGVVGGIITQNVDGLHHAAGNRTIVELHGSLDYVVCLTCGDRSRRDALQERLMAANLGWVEEAAVGEGQPIESAPDGDAELADAPYADFRVLACAHCDGVLKPDVVFFGENVPRDRVASAWRLVDDADVLVVVGSSLAVYSGRRFVYGAVERGMPVAVVNLGPTRADEVAHVRVEGRLGEVMPLIVESLTQYV